MKLAIDIGNSFIHFAVYKNSKIMHSIKYKSSDKPNLSRILSFIKNKYNIEQIGIASVNDKNGKTIYTLCGKFFKLNPLTINHKTKLPIKIKIKSPASLGADRICNAVYGYIHFKCKENVLIADLGTANTFDVVTQKGEFIGGIIAPGVMTSSKALNKNTGNLPMLEYRKLSPNAPIIGKDTFHALQSGLVNYMKFAAEGIVSALKKQFKGRLKVIMTGGSSELLLKKVKFKYIHIENTVLDGINIILNYQHEVK